MTRPVLRHARSAFFSATLAVIFSITPVFFGVNIAYAADITLSTNTTITGAGCTDNAADNIEITSGAVITVDCGANANGWEMVNLTVTSGTIDHPDADADGVKITATGDVDITAGGTVNLDGLGHNGGVNTSGDGPGGGGGDGGGAHIGDGGGSTGGSAYGNIVAPDDLGSGGGGGVNCCATQTGGDGGGLLIIDATAGTVTVDGTITADGTNGTSSGGLSAGGGAGGSVQINASTFAGSGSIGVNGGNGVNSAGTGSGGGIAITFSTSTFSGTFSAISGQTADAGDIGAAGSIYLHDTDTTVVDLTFDNGGTDADEFSYLSIADLGGDTVDTLTIDNARVDFDAVVTAATVSFAGTSFFEGDGITSTNDVTFPTGTILRHTDADTDGLVITAPNIDLESGATISLNSYGYSGGSKGVAAQGPGAATSGGSGGSYGGLGGGASAGPTYGSATEPTDLGSGGRGSGGCCSDATGGDGGGAVKFEATGTVTIDGTITADGGNGSGSSGNGGGGSGGSVWIDACDIEGSGSISADGGNGQASGGGGGGGRIAFTFSCSVTYAGARTVDGGTGNVAGADGTVFVFEIESAVTDDTDDDGQIDAIVVTFTDDVDAGTVTGADFTLSGGYAVASASETSAGVVTIVVTESGSVDSDATPTVTVVGSITRAGSADTVTSGNIASTDGADPVIVSIAPADGATGVATNSDIVITFSEPMDTGTVTVTVTNEPAGRSNVFSGGNEILTIGYTSNFSTSTASTVTVTAGDDPAGNTFGGALVTHPATFTTAATNPSSGGSGAPAGGPTVGSGASLTLTLPGGSEVYKQGEVIPVAWTTSGYIPRVRLSYTKDAGKTYTFIETDLTNTGSYNWQPPSALVADAILIRVEAFDGVTVYAEDELDLPIAINAKEQASEEPAATSGISPHPLAGQYIRTEDNPAVYFVTVDGKRRVALDTRTFLTHEMTFKNVRFLTVEEVAALPVGEPLLPKAGVSLLTFWGDNAVYWAETVNGEYVLHKIDSETVALAMFGADWAGYVLDVNPAYFSYFTLGDPTLNPISIDTSQLVKRELLSVLAGMREPFDEESRAARDAAWQF